MLDSTNNVIKGYQLFEELGAGGFGAVYLARQALLKRNVAIKVILPKYANEPEFVRRFEIEAELIARLEHPHIVPIYDFWRGPDGAYIIMRYIKGINLGERLAVEVFTEQETVDIIQQLASALNFAHRHHVVHRDIKPENVLLDEDGNAYLVDFGIAKDLSRADDTEEQGGGTLMYAAPEQLTGDTITSQTDLYAVGLLVYEMLTGNLPHERSTPHAIKQLQFDQNLPETNLLSDEILDILRRATHPTAAERFESAIELSDALRDAIELDLVSTPMHTISLDDGHDEQVDLTNPYRGLLAFQEYDSHNFYGRDTLVDRMINRLTVDDHIGRFLAVVGPSGSGKSSIVKAGLIPQVRAGAIEGSDDWFIVEMYPGINPLIELEAALLRISVNPPDSLLAQLQQENGFNRALKRVLPADENVQLLLVIDQFEELFTQVEDENLRLHFITSMLATLADPHSRLRVVITLRADFYDKPLQYHDFGELLRKRTEIVLPLSADELTAAIQQPANNAGAVFETGLVNAIVSDVNAQPGMLPLLQYALTQLFDRRHGRTLSFDTYEQLGGVTGALAQRADEIYHQLSDTQKQSIRQLFLRLVTLGEGAEDTRRRVRQTELDSITDIDMLLNIFGQARLLTFDRDPATRVPTVEVAHEALIRNWDIFKGWVDDTRDELHIQRNLTSATAEWIANDRSFGFLARDARLDQFEAWADYTDLALSTDEDEFITQSINAREERNRAEQARKANEAIVARRAQNFKRASAVLGIMVVIMIGATFVGVQAILFSREADRAARTEVAMADAAQQTSAARENEANQQVFEAGETLTPIPMTLDAVATQQIDAVNTREAVQDESYRYLMAGQASFLQANESDALAFAFEAIGNANPPMDIQPIFYEIASQSHNRLTITDHTAAVNSVAFNPDRNEFASASDDMTVKLWDTHTGDEVSRFVGHNSEVNSVAFSPNGQLLATAGDDMTIKLWNTRTGDEVNSFTGHEASINDMSFSPSGEMLASASDDSSVGLWDIETGQNITMFPASKFEVNTIAFSPDGKTIITAYCFGINDFGDCWQGEITIYDVLTQNGVARLQGHRSDINDVVFSPDGQLFATAGDDGTINLWETPGGQVVLTLFGHESEVERLSFSPDGQMLASGSADMTVKLWDLSNGQVITTFGGHSSTVTDVAFNADGKTIVSSSDDRTVRLWDVLPALEKLTLSADTELFVDITFHPDGLSFASVGTDGAIILWDAQTGEQLLVIDEPVSSIGAITFSPDGQTIISVGNSINIWDAGSGDLVTSFEDNEQYATVVTLDSSGTILASGHINGTIKLWDMSNGRELLSMTDNNTGVWELEFSPDRQTLVSAHDDGLVRLWSVETGQLLQSFEGHESYVFSVSFSPDGQTIASGGEDRSAKIWSLTTGQILHSLGGNTDAVTMVDFSPDGQVLITASDTLKLWDVTSGQELLKISGDTPRFIIAKFSPNGTTVVSANTYAQIESWNVSSLPLMRQWIQENRTLREFTCEERLRYNMPVKCDVVGNFPTRTPFPTPSPIP